MGEAEAYRHRQRVVAFALLTGAFAGLLNGGVAAWDEPHHHGGFTWLGVSNSFHWEGRSYPDTFPWYTRMKFVNLTRVVPATGLVALLVVTIGTLLVEMPNTRASRSDPATDAIWRIAVCLLAGLMSQTLAVHLRPPDTGIPAPSLLLTAAKGVFRGIVLGLFLCGMVSIAGTIFRKLDDRDWWPPQRFFVNLRHAGLCGATAAGVCVIMLAFDGPVEIGRRPSTCQLLGWKSAEEKQASFVASIAAFEGELRERNAMRAIPAAAVGSFGLLFVAAFGIRAIPGSRLRAAAWVLAWVGAGVVSHWLAVEFRGQLWLYFAPIGADYDEHHARMILRGGLIGAAAGLGWVVAVAAFAADDAPVPAGADAPFDGGPDEEIDPRLQAR